MFLFGGDIIQQIMPSIMLIGCGPHAKRVYLPALRLMQREYSVQLKIIVELEGTENMVKSAVSSYFQDVECIFVKPYKIGHQYLLSEEIEKKLDWLVKDKKINGVIIATNPLNHMS